MSDAREYSVNEPLLVEPVSVEPVPVAAQPVPVVAEPVPVVVEPTWAEPMVSDPVWNDTVVVDHVVAPVVAAPMVVSPAVPVATSVGTVRRSYARSFAPDAIVAALVGLFVMLVGLLAITRGGFEGSMDTPVVSVLGFSHTTLLGLMEIIIGGSLLLSGATRSRSAAMFFGSVLGIAAFVGAVQTESFHNNLALESGFAWLLVFASVIIVLSTLLLPRYSQRSTVVYPV
jgi:hypothetical protein